MADKYRSALSRKLAQSRADVEDAGDERRESDELVEHDLVDDEPEEEEDVQEDDDETYSHKWKCTNCGEENIDDFEKGVTIEDALGDSVVCSKCGCH